MAEPIPQPAAPPPPPTDKAGNVYVRAADGTLGTVAPNDVQGVIASGGTVATARDQQQVAIDAIPTAAKIAKVATGDAGFWLQGGQFTPEGSTYTKGVASGATMGLSDLATKGVGQAIGGNKLATQLRDTSNAFDAESPLAAKLGEGTGMVAGALAGGAMGGAGLGRAGLALPSAGISALGGGAEAAVARLTAGMMARGALGRAGSTALQFAARGAVEGALMEGAHATTDALFQDHDLAAEKILIAAGKGGLYGFAAGGALGAGGSLLASGARSTLGSLRSLSAMRGVAASVAEKTEGAVAHAAEAEGAAAKQLGSTADHVMSSEGAEGFQWMRKGPRPTETAEEAVNAGRQAKNAAAADAGTGFEKMERGAGELATATEKKAGAGWADAEANTQAVKSLYGDRTAYKHAVKAVGDDGIQEMGALLLKRNIVQAGESIEQAMPRLQAVKSQVGDGIGAVFAKHETRLPISAILDDAAELQKTLGSNFKTLPAARAVKGAVDDLHQLLATRGAVAPDGTIALSELVSIRRQMDGYAYATNAMGPSKEAIADLARKMEGRIVSALDELGTKAGAPETKQVYFSLKRDYELLSEAEAIAEKGLERLHGNNSIGIGDKIAAGFGAVTGAVFGGGIGAAAGSAALGGASYLAKTRGNATIAVALKRMGERGAADAAIHTFDDVTARAAAGILKTAGKDAAAEGYIARNAARNTKRGYASGAHKAAKAAEPLEARTRTEIAEVRRLEDPATQQAHIDEKVGHLRQTAPMLAASMDAAMKRSIQFLASKMPEETKNYAPLSAPTRKPSINPVQAAQFLRYKEAVENPQGALERFGRGEVRREDVETLRVVAPKAFETIQVRVLQRLTDAQARGVVIPHEQRLKLSLLLDIKGDATLEPGMLRVLQKNVSAPPEGGGNGPQQGGSKRPVQLAGTQHQGMDKLEAS